jgi:fumarate reductase subunit D
MDSDSPMTWEKLEIKKTNYLLNLIIILLLILIIFIILHHIDHIKTNLKILDKSIYNKKEIEENDTTNWDL